MLIISFYFFYVIAAYGYHPTEPSIECTVVKVLKQQNIGKLKKFPQLYTSINNNPATSRLFITGLEFKSSDPVSQIKTETFEKIMIQIEESKLILELHGKPVSRNGVLKLDSIVLAKVTCH